tara:strand:- start:353 stop:2089 length:1737 start_codon:yes stop_codon:yes gene_type:complete
MAGAYENPQRITGDTYASAFTKQIANNNAAASQRAQINEQEARRAQEKKENEQRRIIENMQRVQGNADVWNLEQMNKLATAPRTNAIQDELMKTLNDRIGIATDAQIYLKTQFGDEKARVSAQKAITDYYDLLNLTKTATANFAATGKYWRENAAKIGKDITIIGSTPEEIANNQFFVNAIGSVHEADFEMVYDEEKNDIMIKVSGNEPTRTEDGKLIEGDYREKYISARAWNAQTAEGKEFEFVSNVPQIVAESLERMKPADRTPNNDGLGIIKANGQFADKYWTGEEIYKDSINTSSGDSRKTEEVRRYLDVNSVRNDMLSILKSKIQGVNGNVQQAANAWNIDLKQLNEGIENEYQNVQPTDEQFEQVLFDQILKARVSGLEVDEQGRYYISSGRSIIQPKAPSTSKAPNIGYRTTYYNNILLGAGDSNLSNTDVTLDNLMKITGPSDRYMTKDQTFDVWLNTPFADFKGAPTNKEHYENEGESAQGEFDKLFPRKGLYKIISNKPVFAGDYDFDSAEERLKFALDNTTASERKAIQNETVLFKRARQVDWMSANPKRTDETLVEYAERMDKAIK